MKYPCVEKKYMHTLKSSCISVSILTEGEQGAAEAWVLVEDVWEVMKGPRLSNKTYFGNDKLKINWYF